MADKKAEQKPEQRQGGLGKGLAALIPSGPGAPSRKPRLGDSAADIILGASTGAPKEAGAKKVQGAPTIQQSSGSQKRQAKPSVIGATYREISVGDILPNPKQPRTVFDEDELAELVHSIKEFGLLQPVVVRPSEEGGFELIMGERRWRASSKAGLATIPAIVRDTKDDDLLRDALLENIHRVQLNPLEEAHAYQQLLEEFGVTQNELADRIGRSRPQVTNMIRLLKLPVDVQKRVAAGTLSGGHARALLGLPDAEAMELIANRVVAEGLSVRATEEAVTLYKRDGKPAEPTKKPAAPQPQFFTDSAERLADRFDTKVTVTMGKRKGKMVVEFGDQEDFERIMALIEGTENS
ncbi:ParB/RepB/Spo0J family partition protein [Corynebacterium sp. YSMAA1_1_D6]|uniref:ParB/RepB/Spo0J family partition protein n=1 Tax=unclassified Corynebacterium TaxID=2624378 RepID=UPI0038CFB660